MRSALSEQQQSVNRMEIELKAAISRRDQMSISLGERKNEVTELDETASKDEAQIEEQYKEWEASRLEKETLEALAVRYRHLDASDNRYCRRWQQKRAAWNRNCRL